MVHKYGTFSQSQMRSAKQSIRKSIFFLLVCVDPKTNVSCNLDVNQVFLNVLYKIDGLNEILFYPPEIVSIVSLLQSAMDEYNKSNFNFQKYRKLILDAGAEVLKIKEVD